MMVNATRQGNFSLGHHPMCILICSCVWLPAFLFPFLSSPGFFKTLFPTYALKINMEIQCS